MVPSPELPNPYQPPASATLSDVPPLADAVGPARRVRHWFDLFTLTLVALASGAYLAFIGKLFDSSLVDRWAGFLFLLNVPLLVLWFVQLWRHHRVGFRYGWWVVTTQLIITLAMISMGIGDPLEVLRINGWITLGFVLLTLQCHGVIRIAESSRKRLASSSKPD